MSKKVKGWLELVLGVGISMKGVYDIIESSVNEKEVPEELECKSKYANMEVEEEKEVKKEED